MTTDRDFDRIAMAWLADGPEELSDRVLDAVVDRIHLTRQRRALRVPWRFPTMTMPARVAALIAVGALVLAGALAIAGVGGSVPIPTTQPSAAVVPTETNGVISTLGLPVLDATFSSPRHGYHVMYPSDWTVTPASQYWRPGTRSLWGDPTLDELKGADLRFDGVQQTYADGQTADAWLQWYCQQDPAADCSNPRATWESIQVAGTTGYIDIDGADASGGTIVPGGKIYEVVVPTPERAYVFTVDGNADRSTLDAFLSTIELKPGEVVDTPPLTGRFTSPTYGYSIATLPEWTTTASTKAWTDTSNDSASMDGIDGTGADGVGATSQPLGDRTFAEFLAAFEAQQHSAGCGGGDPATWQSIPIGDQTGVFYDACGSAEALVQAGDRVYLFELGHGPSGVGQTFSVAEFKQLLTSVILDPASAK